MRMISKHIAVAALVLGGIFTSESAENLHRKTGKIYSVNFEDKSFEFITATAYDPQKAEGSIRHKVYWDKDTIINSVVTQKSFAGLTAPQVGYFYYLSEQSTKSIKEGALFSARFVEVSDCPPKPTGLRQDGKTLKAEFTIDGPKKATVSVNGKKVPFVFGRKSVLNIIKTETEKFLKHELFKAQLSGKVQGDRFVLSSVRLTKLPDPRKNDDPNLPRFLVIGDSISMNYDKAARKALEGIVNYHRIDGNGGPTQRALESMDLWLGNYQKKGFQWDIIQFNHGLHDLKQPNSKNGQWTNHSTAIEQYKKNLEIEIQMLKKTGAQLIWATTTPVPNDSEGGSARKKDMDLTFNAAAMEVLSKYPEILVTDLNQAVRTSNVFDTWRTGNNVHFKTDAELKVLGDTVATTVKRAIQ